MRIDISYNSYNTNIAKAKIFVGDDPIIDGHDTYFQLSVTEDEAGVEPKKVELKSVDDSLESVALSMTLEEMRQFNLLMTQFLRQIAAK